MSRKSDLAAAEAYIRQDCNETHISALVRHYHVEETQQIVNQFAGTSISADDAAGIVQKIRNEYNMGEIVDYNMPGYVDEESEEDWSEPEPEERSGFARWLFGK